jgi:hypothetical protein
MQDDTQQTTPRQPDQLAHSVTTGPVNLPDAPDERGLVMRPSPSEAAAAYWLAVQSARQALGEAAAQIREARRLRDAEIDLGATGWLRDNRAHECIATALESLPTLPTTGAALDGGCIDAVDTVDLDARRSTP